MRIVICNFLFKKESDKRNRMWYKKQYIWLSHNSHPCGLMQYDSEHELRNRTPGCSDAILNWEGKIIALEFHIKLPVYEVDRRRVLSVNYLISSTNKPGLIDKASDFRKSKATAFYLVEICFGDLLYKPAAHCRVSSRRIERLVYIHSIYRIFFFCRT